MFDYNHNYLYFGLVNGLVGRVFANVLGDLGSIQDWVTPKTLKMVLDASRIKWSNPGKGVASFPALGVVAIEKGAFRLPTIHSYIISNNYFYSLISHLFCTYLYGVKNSYSTKVQTDLFDP